MGTMRWLVIFVLMGTFSQAAATHAYMFSTTSKTAILKWTRISGASSYTVSAALLSSPGIIVAFSNFGPNTVMGSVSSLSPDTFYVFTVQALGSSQEILRTETVISSTALEMMDPIQTVESKDSTSLTVEFTLKSSASSYIIRVQSSGGFYREYNVSSSPAEIQSLTPYTEYTISIMAISNGWRSQPTPSVTAKTVLSPPQLSTSSPSNDTISISWAPIANAVHYSLSTFKLGSNTSMQYNTTDTNITISGLDAGSLYTIKGYAWDPEGRKGEESLEVNQTTRPPTPFSVNISVVMSNNVTKLSVSWAIDPDVYGSIDYWVTSDHNLTCNSTSSPCVFQSPVDCGEAYTIKVTASNEAGPSYPSDPEVFITFPCPPESLTHAEENTDENCTLSWNTVEHADGYRAFIKRADGAEEICNTTSNNCTYHCQCGYTYLLSVVAFNQAGDSPPGDSLSHTTVPCCPEDLSVSVVSPDSLEMTWTASRGAVWYQTRAVDGPEVILCNDTAPECVLSDLSCDSPYSVAVMPCNDFSGCNYACQVHNKDTAPCMPTNMVLTEKNSSCFTVSWTTTNRAANYTVSAVGDDGALTYTTTDTSYNMTDLPCGSTFEVTVTASTAAGQSLPSYSDSLETEPCCPATLTVVQVTQAMTNVSWSHAKGANIFVTSLTSPRGHARCHTQDSHCIMGCITCGTNYTVAMEAQSHSGRVSNCIYEGFSSSACCPSGIRLYKMADNSVQVNWRSSGSSHSHIVEMVDGTNSLNCTASPGEHKCTVTSVLCGRVYHVVVAPLTAEGSKGTFCAERLFSVTCSSSTIGSVIYRGKRSVD